MTSNLARRVAFAAVAIPSVLAIAWVGRWALGLLLALAGALGAHELFSLARKQGIEPLGRVGMASAALAPIAVTWTLLSPGGPAVLLHEGYLAVLWLVVVLAIGLWRRSPDRKPLEAVAVTVFGALYAGWLPSFALRLRHPLPGPFTSDARVGMALLACPLVLTWFGDTAAMAAGTAIGGRKLAPVVSPNKTWAGAIAGLLGAMALSLVYAATVFGRAGVSVSVSEALIIGAVIGVSGQVGDVVESLFKREAGQKDSSALLPGHGGVLDRLDSLYFALPMTALCYRLVGIT